EDPQPELVLEPADLLAEHLLGHPQPLRRTREVQLVGDGHGIAQATELGHRAIVTSQPAPVSPGELASIRSQPCPNSKSWPCSHLPRTTSTASRPSWRPRWPPSATNPETSPAPCAAWRARRPASPCSSGGPTTRPSPRTGRRRTSSGCSNQPTTS